jgi:ribose transport system ATP-binding protein
MDTSVRFLSGGNQQKVVIARWLYAEAKVLILDEPTQGIDVGAKLDVYGVINDLAAHGVAIVLISSDYPELIAMSDRIAVIREGAVLTVLPAEEMTEHRLIAIASGAEALAEPHRTSNRRATA